MRLYPGQRPFRLTTRAKALLLSAVTAPSIATVITQVENGVAQATAYDEFNQAYVQSQYYEEYFANGPSAEIKTEPTAVPEEAENPKTVAAPKQAEATQKLGNYSPIDVARVARVAGFRGEALVTVVAISIAENRQGEPGRLGDVKLMNHTWGPSVGLTQVRSLNKDDHTGRTRDRYANVDPVKNLRAAYELSGSGKDFSPWSTYTDRSFEKFLTRAREAAYALESSLSAMSRPRESLGI